MCFSDISSPLYIHLIHSIQLFHMHGNIFSSYQCNTGQIRVLDFRPPKNSEFALVSFSSYLPDYYRWSDIISVFLGIPINYNLVSKIRSYFETVCILNCVHNLYISPRIFLKKYRRSENISRRIWMRRLTGILRRRDRKSVV
mgnify:CR=1 FL=1